jgi:hypothetical protein
MKMKITLEMLEFLNEEVIVTKKTSQVEGGSSEQNVFSQTAVNQEKGELVECTVLKIGKEQKELKEGDSVLIREDFLTPIRIKNSENFENKYLLLNHKIIFAKC